MSRPSPTLHELLAIEGALEGQATKCRTQLAATFTSKRHLFEEKSKVFTPLLEGAQKDTSVESTLQSTVPEELDWITPFITKALDAGLQIAEANTQARADIVLESGETLATGVPATALLELEKRINEVKTLIEAVPTLDPAKGFEPYSSHAKKHVFKARDVRKPRTQKAREVLTLAQATDKHPAQVQLLDVDKVIGHVDEQEWSGLITPATKAGLITRVETLVRAVKAARSRANNVEVNRERSYGAALLGYVFNGKA
jgi:hypothetical protein